MLKTAVTLKRLFFLFFMKKSRVCDQNWGETRDWKLQIILILFNHDRCKTEKLSSGNFPFRPLDPIYSKHLNIFFYQDARWFRTKFFLKCQRMLLNAILLHMQASRIIVGYAPFMSVCNFICLCSCMLLSNCCAQSLYSCMYIFLFKSEKHVGECVRIILKQWSESLWTSTLGTEIREREATLVPCHHPKTELLQNILKCFQSFVHRDTKSVRRESCESSSGKGDRRGERDR